MLIIFIIKKKKKKDLQNSLNPSFFKLIERSLLDHPLQEIMYLIFYFFIIKLNTALKKKKKKFK